MEPQFEAVKVGTEQSFKLLHPYAKSFGHPYHYHPEVELTLILRGFGTRIVGDHVAPFGPGDLCLIGANLPHIYHKEALPDSGDAAESIVVQFSLEYFAFLRTLPEFGKISRMIDRAGRGLCFPEAVSDVRTRLGALEGLEPMPRLLRVLEILAALAGEEGEVLCSPGLQFRGNERHRALVDEICQYMFAHLEEPLSLADVARQAQLTPSAFSRFFQRNTQQSFTQFLTNIRLGRACRLLLRTDLSVAEICYASGFGNLSNFNRRFKERFSVSPRVWRSRELGAGMESDSTV